MTTDELKKAGITIIDPHRCETCGKLYGKSNATYRDIEVWLACDCHPKDLIYFIDRSKLQRNIEAMVPSWSR